MRTPRRTHARTRAHENTPTRARPERIPRMPVRKAAHHTVTTAEQRRACMPRVPAAPQASLVGLKFPP